MTQCQHMLYEQIACQDDGCTGVDGDPGTFRLRQCKRTAHALLSVGSPPDEQVALCSAHVGALFVYGSVRYGMPGGETWECSVRDFPWLVRL